MTGTINIILDKVLFSPYHFYQHFLLDLAKHYQESSRPINLQFYEHGDSRIYDSSYRIDPISIPLILSLFEQLSKYHKHPLETHLYNNNATIKSLEFLARSDFFKLAGNDSYIEPYGRNILKFNKSYLGAFRSNLIRKDHRVRAYSLHDEGLDKKIESMSDDRDKRDYLNSHFTYKTKEHFAELLFDNPLTTKLHNTYLDILTELITNGVLHSMSHTYALMFVDRYKTKFSISDNGIGLMGSMKSKKSTFYYTPNEIYQDANKIKSLQNYSPLLRNNLSIHFETLYYSALKDREGLFDLMNSVVIESKGIFRIHTDYCQIIISNRMLDSLVIMAEYRKDIMTNHIEYSIDQLSKKDYQSNIHRLSSELNTIFKTFMNDTISKFNTDAKYSAIRFFNVRFKGVHIEVEIPRS